MRQGEDLAYKVTSSLAVLEAYLYKLEAEVRLLRQENLELTHECNDLSAANIMARASKDYANSIT